MVNPASRREPTLYDVLQVSSKATSGVIRASYRVLARLYHPDLNPGAEATLHMRELNAAYDVLGDEQRRAQYDAERLRATRLASRRLAAAGKSAGVVSHRRAASSPVPFAVRIRVALLIGILVASLALALWLFVEALTDTPWSVFLA